MKQKGFTLIEILVAVTLLGIIGTITTEMFSRLILVSKKTTLQSEIKRNSESVLSQLERTIRNADKIEYLGSFNSIWDYQTLSSTTESCSFDSSVTTPGATQGCAIIIQNPSEATYTYTRIAFLQTFQNVSRDITANEYCGVSLFDNQVVEYTATNKFSCNGSVRINTSNTLSDLMVDTMVADVSLTNLSPSNGVSIPVNSITIALPPSRPPVVQIRFTMEQPFNIVLRDSKEIRRSFTTVLSLRNY